ncbi:ABC transporter permease [Halosolutus gelatinilyticus]|uniref:ABC transporter permease n=1 Tax=Halosolutus gelatinilyticus TaxID=2931975 RepID=UPI001FF442B0|nr:ABC transporter permease [Halosolutus gelatinilyticus]
MTARIAPAPTALAPIVTGPIEQVIRQATDPAVAWGFLQIAVAAALVAAVLGIATVRRFDFQREVGSAMGRGFLQILAAGSVIGVLLTAHLAWAGLVLAFMVAAAAWISHERAAAIPGAFRASLVSIAIGAGAVIAAMTIAGAIEPTMRDLIVVGSMIIAMAMKTNSLALDRFASELAANRAEIEAVLSLGVPPQRAIEPHVSTSVYGSLIPIIDRTKSLGIVSIPGLMAGMVIAGANPIYAAQYQFAIMMMLFAAGGLTTMLSTYLISGYAFTAAQQLDPDVLRAAES